MKSNLNKLAQKYDLNAPQMAQALSSMGRRGDTLLAHITPQEASLLKRHGGAGTRNPRTGLLEFYDADGSGNAADSGSPTGSDGGGDGGSGGGDGGSGGGDGGSGGGDGGSGGGDGGSGGGGYNDGSGGGYNDGSGGDGGSAPPTSVDPAYFESLYRTLLNRAPEPGAVDYWVNAANQFGLDAARASFDYGVAQELATRSKSAAPINVPTPIPSTGTAPTVPGLNLVSPGAATLPSGSSELATLMRQYGVATPNIAPGPSQFPNQPVDAAKQEADKIAYQDYLNEFMRRLSTTDMYNRPQYLQDPTLYAPKWNDLLAPTGYVPNPAGIYDMYSKYTNPNKGYARGGRVGYAEGGEIDPPVEIGAFPGPSADEGSFVSQPVTVSPAAPAPTETPAPTRSQNLEALLSKYTAPSGEYTRELAAARQAAKTETEAFSNMIRQMAERGESPTSRAEMYFRLASAFGSPTKTGQFTENLALAGKEMGEYAKGRRADEAERRGLALKAQEMRMAGARQDLATTQALAAQEGSERRAMAREVIKEYIASGRPQSDAGKMAQDMGLVPGTQAYSDFVERYMKTKLESGELYRQAMLEISRQGLEIRKLAEARQEAAAKELSPTELKLRESTEDELSGVNQAIRGLTRALEINENAFGNSVVEAAQYQALRAAGSENAKVVNTTELRNLLGRAAISNLKATFGGAPTEGERNALMELEGALSKTPAERRRIIENSLAELRRSADTRKRRLDDIVSGRYRQRTETAPGSSGDNR